MAALLQTEHLSRRFASRRGVDDFTLTLRAGDIVGLAGLNGAGKSTTLSMLAGALRPTRGRVLVNGRDLLRNPVARRDIGFAPDKPPLYPELTVREYLDYTAALRGLGGKAAVRAVDEVLDDCRLGASSQRLIRPLSRGMQQRVGLAQALVHRPSVLLLDEPTEGLDPQQAESFRHLVSGRASTGAILLSTHQLDVISGLCNRLVVLHEGRQVLDLRLAGETTTQLKTIFAEATGTEAQ